MIRNLKKTVKDKLSSIIIFVRGEEEKKGEIILRKGTKITCPNCSVVIAVAKRDIRSGETIDSENVKWLIKQFRRGDELSCPLCSAPVGLDLGFKSKEGEKVYVGSIIHTSEGWVPKPVYELMKSKVDSAVRRNIRISRRHRPLSSFKGKGLRKLASRSKRTRVYERRAGFDWRKRIEED
ncbi:MAG: hypothetical protein DRP01_01550 [Archaeoglobales archaeon]|nr:MAG: hypothetical protein DRP01_01550 [Archaeoglobales archaeon]